MNNAEQIEVKKSKGKGKEKVYDYERKMLGGQVNSAWVDDLVKEYGSATKAINALVEAHRKAKGLL